MTVDQSGSVVQRDDYYPFGLTFNSWSPSRNGGENQYKFNGVELDVPTQTYETRFRGYDAALGRFMQVDPLTDFIPSISSYHFGFNNPVTYNDPLGLMGEDFKLAGKKDRKKRRRDRRRNRDKDGKGRGYNPGSKPKPNSKKSNNDEVVSNNDISMAGDIDFGDFSELFQQPKKEDLSRKIKPVIWKAFRAERERSQMPVEQPESQGIFDAEVDLSGDKGFEPIFVDIPGFRKPKSIFASGNFEFNFELTLKGGKKYMAEGIYSPTGFKVDNTISRIFYNDGRIRQIPTPSGSPLRGYFIKFANKKGYDLINLSFSDKAAFDAIVRYLSGK